MAEPDGAIVEAAISDAIEQVIREQEGGFTLRWIAVIEAAGPNGNRGVWTLAGDDVELWDAYGLLEYGKHQFAARDAEEVDED